MKNSDLFLMAAAALAVYFVAKMVQGGGGSSSGVLNTIGQYANFNPQTTAQDAGFGKLVATYQGYRYYDSGYGRGPDGAIYYQGQKVT